MKMLRPIQLILIQLIFLTSMSFAQSNTTPQLYLCMTDLTPNAKQTLQQSGCSFTTLVNWPDNSLQLDEVAFRRHISTLFPDSSMSGIGVLDWEGPAFSKLRQGDPNSDDYKNNMGQFIRALQIAKQMRPNMKWGYYAIPFINRDTKWHSWNTAIAPLLKECDIFFPSLYQYYSASKSASSEASYVNQNVTECLHLAGIYNKQVMPFVWHRWYIDNKEKGLDLIPLPLFKARINSITQAQYNGKGVDGVVWWGEDTYYYNQNSIQIKREVPTNTDFKTYHDGLITNYGKSIKQMISGN